MPDDARPVSTLLSLSRDRASHWLECRLDMLVPRDCRHSPCEYHQTCLADLAVFCIANDASEGVSGLVRAIWNALSSAYSSTGLHLFPETGHPLCLPAHLIMRRAIGFETSRRILPDTFVEAWMNRPEAIYSARSPMRFAELKWAMEGHGLHSPLPSWKHFRHLAHTEALFTHANRPALYDATHWIYYLTDFGNRDLSWAGGTQIAWSDGLVERALSQLELVLAVEDWDLVSEIVLALLLARAQQVDPFIERALHHLASAQLEDGSWGPNNSSEPNAPLSGEATGCEITSELGAYHRVMMAVWALDYWQSVQYGTLCEQSPVP